MPDPCGSHPGYQAIASCFLHEFIEEHNPRSATVRCYSSDINDLFSMCGVPHPAHFNGKQNMSARLLALKEEEDVVRQQDPITTQTLAAMATRVGTAHRDLPEVVVFQFFCLIRITGLRKAEYAQKVQTKVEVHTYPVSNKKVVMAFIRKDWIFYDKQGRIIQA